MLCLRVLLVAPRHYTNMLSGATGSLPASPKVVSKADWVPLRGSRMHALQSLRHRFSILVFAAFWCPFCIALMKLVGTKLALASRWVLPLLILVCLVRIGCRCAM